MFCWCLTKIVDFLLRTHIEKEHRENVVLKKRNEMVISPPTGENTFSTRSQSALEQTSDASKQPQKEVKIPSLQLDNRKLTTDLVAGSRIVSTRPLSSRKSFQGFRPFLSNSLPTFFLFCPWLGSPILLRLHTQKPLDPDSFCASVSRLAPLSWFLSDDDAFGALMQFVSFVFLPSVRKTKSTNNTHRKWKTARLEGYGLRKRRNLWTQHFSPHWKSGLRTVITAMH